jgi:hypothetical protein
MTWYPVGNPGSKNFSAAGLFLSIFLASGKNADKTFFTG